MSDDQYDSLTGRTAALSLVLNSLIQNLPREVTQRTATTLQAALDIEREEDSVAHTQPTTAMARDAIAEAYVQLLRAVR